MDNSGYAVFLNLFGDPVIILFFGGLALSVALGKYRIDRIIASVLLKLFGHRPIFVLLGFMFTTALLSMWMSDTATAAMMIAMIVPLTKGMDDTDPFKTGLILCIPFASLIGGMATPIGTPPNAIAIGILADKGVYIDFLTWMKMALPLSLILLFAAGLILYAMFPSNKKEFVIDIPLEWTAGPKTFGVILIAILTIALWLTSGFHKIPSAVVALLAGGLFALTGLLDRDDFKNIGWDILILMWGGLALGKGLEISGLAQWIIGLPLFEREGLALITVFSVLAVILSSFMSNTATANLLIPIAVVAVGANNMILAAAIALACSLAMVLPVSTPPNAIAFSTNMLKAKDMFKSGAVIAAVSAALIIIWAHFVMPKFIG